MFLHLLELNDGGESGINRRSHHNHSFDDYNYSGEGHQGQGVYLKYAMSVVTSEGEVVHKIGEVTLSKEWISSYQSCLPENDSIINILPGQSWGEEDFIVLAHLWDPASKLLDGGDAEKLVVRVDLWLFSQLNHVHELGVAPNSGDGKNKAVGRLQLKNKPGGVSSGDGSKPDGVLEALWTLKEFTDVQISAGDKTFAVHKCVISGK